MPYTTSSTSGGSINERFGKLEIPVELQNDIQDLKESLEYIQAQMADLKKENDPLKGTVSTIQKTIDNVERENKRLKEAMLDLQCRSMRDNLIFSGIPENDNDDPEKAIRSFMSQ